MNKLGLNAVHRVCGGQIIKKNNNNDLDQQACWEMLRVVGSGGSAGCRCEMIGNERVSLAKCKHV
jgi:hypothetical protein